MRFFVRRRAVVTRGAGDRRAVALTIDDGPDVLCDGILEALDAAAVRATFFCIGEKLLASPTSARAILAAGHELQNHTQSHDSLLALRTPATNARDLAAAQTTLRGLGVEARYFRPVAGMISPPVVSAAHTQGLQVVHWTATARDGGPITVSKERALRRLERGLVPGGILVLHDRQNQPAVEVIPALAKRAKAAGLALVTLSELLQGDK